MSLEAHDAQMYGSVVANVHHAGFVAPAVTAARHLIGLLGEGRGRRVLDLGHRGHARLRRQDHADGLLQRGILVKLIEDDVAIGVAAEIDVQPHLPAGRFAIGVVDDPGDALDLVVFDEFFELFANPVARILVGDLRDDDRLPVALLVLLDRRARAERRT